MKRTFFISGLFIGLMFWAGFAFGQCTPNMSLTDPEGNGEMDPDTLEAWETQAMNTTLTIICPTSAVVGGNPITIHHIVLKSYVNKPSWMSAACDNANCEYAAGINQCALVTGTAPAGSAATIYMQVLVDVYVDFGPPLGVVKVYTDYNSGDSLVLIIHPYGWGFNEYDNRGDVSQNQPNPFNQETSIGYKSEKAEMMTLKVYDLLGDMIYEERMLTSAGENFFNFTGRDLNSGVYFYTISNGNENAVTRKMIKTN